MCAWHQPPCSTVHLLVEPGEVEEMACLEVIVSHHSCAGLIRQQSFHLRVHSDRRLRKWREEDQNLVIDTLFQYAEGMLVVSYPIFFFFLESATVYLVIIGLITKYVPVVFDLLEERRQDFGIALGPARYYRGDGQPP